MIPHPIGLLRTVGVLDADAIIDRFARLSGGGTAGTRATPEHMRDGEVSDVNTKVPCRLAQCGSD
jgi:hypothetical protein